MQYIVYLYIEGGNYDGESRAAGPFFTEAKANLVADELAGHGRVDVMPLATSAAEILKSL